MTIHEQKAVIIKKYADRYGLDTLIETGTYYGDMVESQRNNFKTIISIELGEELAEKAQIRFKDYSHITILQGDSAEVIKQLLPRQPSLFWLDAHYSANDTAGSEDSNPLVHELTEIAKDKNHVILIDDVHCQRPDLEIIVEGMLVSYEGGVMVCLPRIISNVNFSITTACNRNCINCSYNIPNKKTKHLSEKEIRAAAEHFKDCTITITGGEPTVHPRFTKLAPIFKDIFGKQVSIETNGYGLTRFPELFGNFKTVHITNYTSGNYFKPEEDNSKDIDVFLRNYPDVNVYVDKMTFHKPRNLKGNRICSAGTSVTVSYMNGKVYPCCIGDGYDGAVGVELDGWRDKIRNIPLNCNKCFFSL